MKTRTNFGLSVKQVAKKISNNTIRFDNVVQRGYVWDKKKQCGLINTLLSIGKWIPTPPIFVVKRTDVEEDGTRIDYYDCLDGKQRSITMYRFKNDEFALDGLDEIELEDGSFVDVNGKKYSELPEELQDRINDYTFTFNALEGVTDEEIMELFCVLNNGKPLSAIELTRVHSKSMEKIIELGKHDIFVEAMTEKAINGYANEDVIVKTLIVLNEEKPCLDTKVVRPYMQQTEIEDTDADRIRTILNRIQDAHDRIEIKEDKLSRKIAKRLYTRTHMITLAKVTEKSINMGIEIDSFVSWIEQFYCGAKSPTTSKLYNEHCSSGSGHAPAVKARLDAIEEDFNRFFDIKTDDVKQLENAI